MSASKSLGSVNGSNGGPPRLSLDGRQPTATKFCPPSANGAHRAFDERRGWPINSPCRAKPILVSIELEGETRRWPDRDIPRVTESTTRPLVPSMAFLIEHPTASAGLRMGMSSWCLAIRCATAFSSCLHAATGKPWASLYRLPISSAAWAGVTIGMPWYWLPRLSRCLSPETISSAFAAKAQAST